MCSLARQEGDIASFGPDGEDVAVIRFWRLKATTMFTLRRADLDASRRCAGRGDSFGSANMLAT